MNEDSVRLGLRKEHSAPDEAWLRQCIKEHGEAVYAMARRIVGSPAIAEEIAQDTFVELWRQPERYDPCRGSLRTFLVVVARNKAVDAVRKLHLRQAAGARIVEDSPDPFTYDHATQVAQRIDTVAAFNGLTSRQRDALYLAFFQGLTYREVALRLRIPEGTAKTRIRDGLARLRDQIEAQSSSGSIEPILG